MPPNRERQNKLSKDDPSLPRTVVYNERVISDPQVMGGEPIVKGTRISVGIVLEQLAQNPDPQELFLDYPRLTREDVRACLDFARSLVEKEKQSSQRAEPAKPLSAPA